MKHGVAVLFIVSWVGIGIAAAAPVTQVSQYGITWHFDKPYETGTFANGDYWVIGPVTIDSITPGFNGINHGWQVNPRSSDSQGFAAGAGGFSPELVPRLPYTAVPGQSIVKSISKHPESSSDCYTTRCLTTAAILTVVEKVPPDSGASVWRPPYVGTLKPYYSVPAMRTDLLPAYRPVSGAPSLTSITERFKRVQLHHGQGRMGRCIRPESNMRDYQPENAIEQNEAILRLMLDDPAEDKRPALIAVLQAGIDAYHAVLDGQTWPAGGGYEPGHKVLISFTAAMLDDEQMKATVNAATFWMEHKPYYRSRKTGVILWGFTPPEGSWKTHKDTAEYIDAPTVEYGGDAYLKRLAVPIKTATLAVRLMPSLREMWRGEEWSLMSQFIDRWVNHGWWTQPDPYDRFPEKHGTEKDAGDMASVFIKNVWNAYGSSSEAGKWRSMTFRGTRIHPRGAGWIIAAVVSKPGDARLSVYDPAGRNVRDILFKNLPAGGSDLYWDGSDRHGKVVQSGVYVCSIQSAGRDVSSSAVISVASR